MKFLVKYPSHIFYIKAIILHLFYTKQEIGTSIHLCFLFDTARAVPCYLSATIRSTTQHDHGASCKLSDV